ncbi:MAG: response regulator [Bacteroidales bacterium]|jgi:CheY-like chemotaxis protein|nr:response regulator [Bacteroidales bacterium]
MKKYNILIVDDIFTNRLLLQEILTDICNAIYIATNGKQAIKIFEKENIDIILMDIEMPVMNGLETTKYFRENYPHKNIPIIALTAHNPHDFFDDFKDIGFDNLLTKPYSYKKILDAINAINYSSIK